MKQLVIIGASGHGKVVADIAKRIGYGSILFLDDNASVTSCNGYPVVGRSSAFTNYSCDFAVAIGNPKIRQQVMEQLEVAGKQIPALIHPNAVVGEKVVIGMGAVVVAGAVINPAAQIGKGCIINTGSSVDHDCLIGDFVHIAVGAHVAGTCVIGERTWIGAGATVSNNIDICGDCMIGAGAVVVKNIEESGTYIGVPIKRMKMEEKGNGGVTYNNVTFWLSTYEVAA